MGLDIGVELVADFLINREEFVDAALVLAATHQYEADGSKVYCDVYGDTSSANELENLFDSDKRLSEDRFIVAEISCSFYKGRGTEYLPADELSLERQKGAAIDFLNKLKQGSYRCPSVPKDIENNPQAIPEADKEAAREYFDNLINEVEIIEGWEVVVNLST